MAMDGLTDRINSYFFGKMHEECKVNPKSMKAIVWCQRAGLIARKVECPECKDDMKLTVRKDSNDHYEWYCRKSGHSRKRSVRKDTCFERSRLTIPKILLLMWYWVNNIPSGCVKNETDMSGKTLTDWFNFCRGVCLNAYLKFNGKIGGEGKIVEIYESTFDKKKYNREECMEGKYVFGGFESVTDKCFFVVLPDRSVEFLIDVLVERLLPGTTIVSDCWTFYDIVGTRGFEYLRVNHSLYLKDPDTGAHTNTIEGTWRAIEHGLKQPKTNMEKFDGNLAEYIWRRQNNIEIQRKFIAFLDAVKQMYTPEKPELSVDLGPLSTN